MAEEEFGRLFERFKSMLAPYAKRLHVSSDTPSMYGLDMAPESERAPSTWFAGTRLGKRYVSYYLMPIYVQPSLLDGISPELRRRMQGKSCFNFTTIPGPEVLRELTALSEASVAEWAEKRWL